MLRYKVDMLEALKEKGYSTYKLRKEKVLSESTIQALRRGSTALALDNIDRVCRLLGGVQPGDLLEWLPDALAQENKQQQYGIDQTDSVTENVSPDNNSDGQSGNDIAPFRRDRFTAEEDDFEIIVPPPAQRKKK